MEESLAFGVGERCGEALDGADPVEIRGGDAADRPVRAEHEARGSEGGQRGFQVRQNLLVAPSCVVGFGDEAGNFAENIRTAGEVGEVARPGIEFSGADGRLGDVIEDKNLVGMTIDEADGGGKLVVDNEDVVGEIAGAELRESGVEVGAIHVCVGLSLEDVANTFERGMVGEAVEEIADGGIGEREPADDAGDPRVRGGPCEEGFGLGEGLARLDGDDGVDVGGGDLRGEVGGEKVATDRSHRVVDPVVLGGRVMPEVMMRVDAHRGRGDPGDWRLFYLRRHRDARADPGSGMEDGGCAAQEISFLRPGRSARRARPR